MADSSVIIRRRVTAHVVIGGGGLSPSRTHGRFIFKLHVVLVDAKLLWARILGRYLLDTHRGEYFGAPSGGTSRDRGPPLVGGITTSASPGTNYLFLGEPRTFLQHWQSFCTTFNRGHSSFAPALRSSGDSSPVLARRHAFNLHRGCPFQL